ncbi:MAG TPA: DUF2975 domain-containing protein, partial [Rhizobiales bacterium]|nr:DUF2975 domain-containing protein [Hyphomicrobiales bacterium]
MKNIPRLAKLMSAITGLTIFFLAAAFIFIWFNHTQESDILEQYLPGISNTGIGRTNLKIGFLMSLLPLGLLIYGLFQVFRFFRLYVSGELFPPHAGILLSRFGLALLGVVPAKILVYALTSVIFSLHLPSGKRQLSVAFGSEDFLLLVIGGLIFMIGHLLNSATEVAE